MRHRWAQPVAWSFAERAAWAAGNLVANVLLGRFLSSQSYGAFVLGQSMFLISMGLYAALVLEPMNVLGPRSHHNNQSEYLDMMVSAQILLGGCLAGLAFLGAGVAYFWSRLLAATFVGVALSMPPVLSYCALRTASYVYGRPWLATGGSFAYLIVSVVGILLLHYFGILSPPLAFIVQGFSALVSCLMLARQMNVSPIRPQRLLGDVETKIIHEHWAYGRWALAASVTHTVASGLYGPLIGWTLGLSQVAIFRINQILIGPLQHAVEAVASVLLPWLSTQMRLRGPRYLRQLTGAVSPLAFLAGALYGLLVIFAGPYLLEILFHNSEYRGAAWALKPFALAGAIMLTGQFAAMAVRALGRPRILLWSKAIPAVLFITLGPFAMITWGLRGALFGYVISCLAEAIVLLVSVFGLEKSSSGMAKAFAPPPGTA